MWGLEFNTRNAVLSWIKGCLELVDVLTIVNADEGTIAVDDTYLYVVSGQKGGEKGMSASKTYEAAMIAQMNGKRVVIFCGNNAKQCWQFKDVNTRTLCKPVYIHAMCANAVDGKRLHDMFLTL